MTYYGHALFVQTSDGREELAVDDGWRPVLFGNGGLEQAREEAAIRNGPHPADEPPYVVCRITVDRDEV